MEYEEYLGKQLCSWLEYCGRDLFSAMVNKNCVDMAFWYLFPGFVI